MKGTLMSYTSHYHQIMNYHNYVKCLTCSKYFILLLCQFYSIKIQLSKVKSFHFKSINWGYLASTIVPPWSGGNTIELKEGNTLHVLINAYKLTCTLQSLK